MEVCGVPPGQIIHSQLLLQDLAAVQTIQEPSHKSPYGDGVKTKAVRFVTQLFSSALIEYPAEWSQALVGFVILFVYAFILLAHCHTGFPAGLLLFGDYGFGIELFQIMFADMLLMEGFTLAILPVYAAIVESQEALGIVIEIYAESTAGVHLRIEAVFLGGFHIFGHHLLLVAGLEPFVRYLAIPKVLVDMSATIDDGADAVLLKEFGTKAASACPSVNMAQFTVFDGYGYDSADITVFCSGAYRQNPGIVFIAVFICLMHSLHHGVDPVLLPDQFFIYGIHVQLDLLAVLAVQHHNGGIWGFSDD